ncbi:MAG: polysaccharide deacetylase family protein [Senegalia sp. (in: firmicutes)]|uniref:polysaccharide deacetylase family protein n=1 Tax=Senegalia sp. (in: firmicutes) TaxID=1924098 RepID=UPI003F9B45E1
MKKIISIFLILFVALSFSACNSDSSETSSKNDENNKENAQTNEKEEVKEEKEKEETISKEDIDLSLSPNENGEIMVLMYHGITDEEDVWDRTHENFRRDLQTLYDEGYRPISLEDFVNNNITTEAGYTPVVLTFDDGRQNNFDIIEENGEKNIDPNSAVAILEEFHKENPDFPLEATFFLNGSNPFGQAELIEYKLKYILDKGMDIGNHTINHNDMTNVSSESKIQEYVGGQVKFINSVVPDYQINTYALCNGGRPDESLEKYLEEGSFEDTEYKNVAILNVGWKPSVSPINTEFNPLSIQRVRASETEVDGVGMYDWMEGFRNNPDRKFISDGSADIITVPKAQEESIDQEKIKGKELYIYEK